MKSNSFNIGQSHIVTVEHGFSWFEKYALKHSHPRALFLDVLGIVWFFYFFWLQSWQMALASIIIGRLLASSTVMQVSPQKMSETILGKIALLHIHPANFIIQFLGFIVLTFGVWLHSTEYILLGFSAILVGHLFGWEKVSSSLEKK